MTSHEAFLVCVLIATVLYLLVVQRDRGIYEQRWRDAMAQTRVAIGAIVNGCPTKQATGKACAGCAAAAERAEDAP